MAQWHAVDGRQTRLLVHEPASGQHRCPRSEPQPVRQIVGREYHRSLAAGGQLLQRSEGASVQASIGFVEQQHWRVVQQGPGDRDTLLLAA